ncbi:uncharacterized protein N7484_002055 [Penicillium longicatenatum]|uniref:uncharacterized protein n=1 Tax=Penicillium longicatenatum TaxID=1561947 RepID=UPI00254981FE|nr:uncharacterized protein N7484_002055 [Penicillium longicatenatum]KAJ5658406.1 hypothetical protein N7484_002055 [Penicillium longicatenatum]
MSFGWSVGDLVNTIELLVSVAASLKEIDGSQEHYQQESAYLVDLASTLQHLKDHDSYLPWASQGVDTLKKSVERFGKRLSARFGDSLGSDNKSNRQSLIERLKGAPRMIQYGLFVSREVDELRRRIDIPLKNVIVGLGIDNNNLAAQIHQIALQTHSVVDDLRISLSNLSATTLGSEEQAKGAQCEHKISEVTHWFNPLPLEDYHRRVLVSLVHSSCEWLFDRDEFALWKSADKIHDRYRMLWIMGKAGAGKTHLAARIIEELKLSASKLAYFYCDAKDDRRVSVTSILRNWTWQLLQQDPFLLDDVVPIIEKKQLASQAVLEDILFTILQRLQDAILVIDGFDECEDQEQAKLYRVLARFSQDARVLVFRRSLNLSNKLMVPDECLILYDISEDDNLTDIHRYIEEGVADLEIDDDDIRKTIDTTLRSGAHGMFLWVALMIEELRRPLFSDADYLETLKYLPEDLNMLYIQILRGLSSHPRDIPISRSLLQLMACARRPLTLHEVGASMKVTVGGTKLDTSAMSEKRLRRTILQYCGPLVTIQKRPGAHPTATLVHSSLKEFLLEPQEASAQTPFKINGGDAHLALTQICLTYLCYDNIEAPPYDVFDEVVMSEDRDTRSWDHSTMRAHMESRLAAFLEKYPLLEYSSLHWWWHLTRSSSWTESYNLLLRLCHSSRKTVRWLQMVQYFQGDRGIWGSSKGQTDLEEIASLREVLPAEDTVFSTWLKSFGREPHSRVNLTKWQNFLLCGAANDFLPEIHVAAYFDFAQLVEDYLLEGVNVNQKSHTRQPPLSLAAIGDSFDSMRVLLRHGADVNATGWHNMTPLQWTSRPSAWPTVYPVPYIAGQILLDAGARISRDCNNNFLALVCQSSFPQDPFCLPFVSLLLKHGAEAVIDQGHPRPPLHWAAICGNAALVKLLLEHGAKHDSSPQGVPGRETPLLHACATTGDKLSVVDLLLSVGASVSARRNDGRSALHLASKHPPQIGMMLLQAGADVNARSMDGCTPLHDAIIDENMEMIDLLLANHSTVDIKNEASLTPLALAVENHCSGAIQRLQAANTIMESMEKVDPVMPTQPSIYWPRHPRDIFEVYWVLQLAWAPHRPPQPILLRILDLARYWLRSQTSQSGLVSCDEKECQDRRPYLISEPIRGGKDRPVREVQFVIWSHDQGFSSYPEFHGTFESSFTWFDVGIEQLPHRPPINIKEGERVLTTNIHASRKLRRHQIIYGESAVKQRGWLEKLQVGDRVSIIPMAQYPAWRNFVSEASIEVFRERRGQLDHASHSKTVDAVPYWALQKRHNGPKWCAARAI